MIPNIALYVFYWLYVFLLSTTALADEWTLTTAGPIFTDSPEALKLGSYAIQPYVASYIAPNSAQNVIQYSPSINFGLGKGWELDMNLQYLTIPGFSQFGNSSLTLKKELAHDSDTYHIWAIPTIAAEVTAALPTGNSLVAGVTYQTVQLVVKKKFEPFAISGEIGVGPLNNYIFSSLAFEHVLDQKTGFGYLLEATQASSPAGSYVAAGPILEINGYPKLIKDSVTSYSFGVYFPITQSNYPAYIAPMAQITFTFH